MEELRSNTKYLIGVTDRRRVAARPMKRERGRAPLILHREKPQDNGICLVAAVLVNSSSRNKIGGPSNADKLEGNNQVHQGDPPPRLHSQSGIKSFFLGSKHERQGTINDAGSNRQQERQRCYTVLNRGRLGGARQV